MRQQLLQSVGGQATLLTLLDRAKKVGRTQLSGHDALFQVGNRVRHGAQNFAAKVRGHAVQFPLGAPVGSNTKPRKRYRPRIVDRDPIELAFNRAAKLTSASVDEVMTGYLAAFRAMREGVATELQWCLLLSGVQVAKAIEALGVVRGLGGHLNAAQAALQAIEQRAMQHGTWVAPALYWQELDHLDSFLPLHRFQLEQISVGELRQANQHAMNTVRGAGGRALQLKDLPCQEQLHLLGGGAP